MIPLQTGGVDRLMNRRNFRADVHIDLIHALCDPPFRYASKMRRRLRKLGNGFTIVSNDWIQCSDEFQKRFLENVQLLPTEIQDIYIQSIQEQSTYWTSVVDQMNAQEGLLDSIGEFGNLEKATPRQELLFLYHDHMIRCQKTIAEIIRGTTREFYFSK